PSFGRWAAERRTSGFQEPGAFVAADPNGKRVPGRDHQRDVGRLPRAEGNARRAFVRGRIPLPHGRGSHRGQQRERWAAQKAPTSRDNREERRLKGGGRLKAWPHI